MKPASHTYLSTRFCVSNLQKLNLNYSNMIVFSNVSSLISYCVQYVKCAFAADIFALVC